jgi:hypothetical protein
VAPDTLKYMSDAWVGYVISDLPCSWTGPVQSSTLAIEGGLSLNDTSGDEESKGNGRGEYHSGYWWRGDALQQVIVPAGYLSNSRNQANWSRG